MRRVGVCLEESKKERFFSECFFFTLPGDVFTTPGIFFTFPGGWFRTPGDVFRTPGVVINPRGKVTKKFSSPLTVNLIASCDTVWSPLFEGHTPILV